MGSKVGLDSKEKRGKSGVCSLNTWRAVFHLPLRLLPVFGPADHRPSHTASHSMPGRLYSGKRRVRPESGVFSVFQPENGTMMLMRAMIVLPAHPTISHVVDVSVYLQSGLPLVVNPVRLPAAFLADCFSPPSSSPADQRVRQIEKTIGKNAIHQTRQEGWLRGWANEAINLSPVMIYRIRDHSERLSQYTSPQFSSHK